MSHGDLTPGNVLVADGHLAGVIDVGSFGPADPALDLISAWNLLEAGPRQVLRDALRCTDLEWERSKAWAFQQAMGLVWYYAATNPVMSRLGRTVLDRIQSADRPLRRPLGVEGRAAPPSAVLEAIGIPYAATVGEQEKRDSILIGRVGQVVGMLRRPRHDEDGPEISLDGIGDDGSLSEAAQAAASTSQEGRSWRYDSSQSTRTPTVRTARPVPRRGNRRPGLPGLDGHRPAGASRVGPAQPASSQ
jgi:hypothetical protein